MIVGGLSLHRHDVEFHYGILGSIQEFSQQLLIECSFNWSICSIVINFDVVGVSRDSPSPPPHEEHLGDPLPLPSKPFPFISTEEPPSDEGEGEGSASEVEGHPLIEDEEDAFQLSCKVMFPISSLLSPHGGLVC